LGRGGGTGLAAAGLIMSSRLQELKKVESCAFWIDLSDHCKIAASTPVE